MSSWEIEWLNGYPYLLSCASHTVENAPYPNLRLTPQRLHEEYRQDGQGEICRAGTIRSTLLEQSEVRNASRLVLMAWLEVAYLALAPTP